MKKTFFWVTFLICIGVISSVGCAMISDRNPIIYATGGENGYTVEINIGDITLLNNNLIRIRLISPELNSIPEEHLGVQSFTDVAEGTIISITAKSDSLFEFNQFNHDIVEDDIMVDGSDSELRFVVNDDITVEVVFSENSFDRTLIISGLEGIEDVVLENSVRFSINGVSKNYEDYVATGISIAPGQTLDYIAFDGIDGYRLDDILIKPKGFDYQSFNLSSAKTNKEYMLNPAPGNEESLVYVDGNSITYLYDSLFDTIFFDEFLSESSKILIVINLVKQCKLDFVYSADMGYPEVYEFIKGKPEPVTDINKYFELGIELQIKAVAKDFHTFNGFGRSTDKVLTFNIYDNRTINLNFNANTYQIDSNLDITTSKSVFRVGETVTFAYNLSSNNDIKKWKLFNADKTVEFGTDIVKRNGNSVSVTLTGDMLVNGKFVLQHEVTDSLKPGILAGILVPGIILPLLIVILAVFIITDRKRKKVIKASLEGKWADMKTKDVGGYINALREGQTGTISKEDVKKAMKEQKQEKKDVQQVKPQVKPEKATSPSVAKKPQAAVSADLLGAKIMPNRTITSNNAVIATLQTDGSITDPKGNIIATARMTDGAILDKNDKVIGIVAGEGLITKP